MAKDLLPLHILIPEGLYKTLFTGHLFAFGLGSGLVFIMRPESSEPLLSALMMTRYIRSISYFCITKKFTFVLRPGLWFWGSAGAGCPVALRSPSSSSSLLLLLLLPGFLLVASGGGGVLGVALAGGVGEGGVAAGDVDVLPVVGDVLQGELGAVAGAQPHRAIAAAQGRVTVSSFCGERRARGEREWQEVKASWRPHPKPQQPHRVSNPNQRHPSAPQKYKNSANPKPNNLPFTYPSLPGKHCIFYLKVFPTYRGIRASPL